MFRRQLAIVLLVASVFAGLPGVGILARAPRATGAGDAWHAHRAAALPIATVALRTSQDAGRPSRGTIGVLPSLSVVPSELAAAGLARTTDDRRPSPDRVSPSPARAPPASFRF